MKKKLLIACLAGLLWIPNAVIAAPFPDKTDAIVQDEGNYIKLPDRQKFADSVKQYPDQYKVVVVDSIKPEANSADEYAHKLYDKYNLPDNAMVIVLDIDTEQVGVYAGLAMQNKGAKLEMLHEKLTAYYEPYRNQKEYMKGIELFVNEVNAEMERLAANPASPTVNAQTSPAKPVPREESIWTSIPWWLYGIVALFLASITGIFSLMIRRRNVFGEVDDVEDWKDELVEKIQMIEVEKSMRKATGLTEEHFAHLVNRKENMLRVRIPDVEMIILEAEDACDRFRFQAARSLLAEGREILAEIEAELSELKTDTTKVVQSKKESKQVIPEISKLVEMAERKLTHYRLEYGLSFHELKVQLDDVEKLRSEAKSALASGDDVQAYEKTMLAQQMLEELVRLLDQIPELVTLVHKEMTEELKQLEQNISLALGDGYDLNESALDTGMLQAKQLLQAAINALEEGSLSLAKTHSKAFEVQVDHIYQTIEDTVNVAQKQVAAAISLQAEQKEAELEALPVKAVQAEAVPVETEQAEAFQVETEQPEQAEADPVSAAPMAMSQEERQVLLDQGVNHSESQAAPEEEIEYELVIPRLTAHDDTGEEQPDEVYEPVIETEDDALDEMERISGALVCIRQQVKRSYLPGVPDELKLLFDQVVQTLGRVKLTMETYNYSLDEVAFLLNEANELLIETQKMAAHTISTCQLAEGAIQYTNRYRRQNRQVNELLSKAEAAFRQLRFSEALHLAEEARLIIEGEPETTVSANRWLIRRKKKEIHR